MLETFLSQLSMQSVWYGWNQTDVDSVSLHIVKIDNLAHTTRSSSETG